MKFRSYDSLKIFDAVARKQSMTSIRVPQHSMWNRKSPRCWSARSKSFPGSKILCRDRCPGAQRSRLSSITRYQPVIQAKSGMSYAGGSPRRPCVCQPAPTHPGSRMISATFMACSTDLPIVDTMLRQGYTGVLHPKKVVLLRTSYGLGADPWNGCDCFL